MDILNHKYDIDRNGVINLVNPTPFVYDSTYIKNRYDSYGYKTRAMSLLRLHFIRNFINIEDMHVLDIGYGNGDFLDTCSKQDMIAYGHDVSGYPLPNNVEKVDDIFNAHYDLITFFDSLEHFYDIDFVKNLDCKYICISVPWCHYPKDASIDWFSNWKHLRPEEHFHHFTRKGLEYFMDSMGYIMQDYDNIEDSIRGSGKDGLPNILTAFFKRGF